MSFVYLGLFQRCANYVLNKILKPIVDWLGDLLNKVFTFLVQNIILPAIEHILLPILKEAGGMIFKAVSGVIYTVFASLLELLNNMNAVFDVIIGITEVEVVKPEGTREYMTLLDLFFRDTSLSKLFWYTTFIAFALCLLFSTVSVARSAFDLEFEAKKPVSRVLSLTFRAMFTMFAMQFFVYAVVRLSGAVLLAINRALRNSLPAGKKPPTLGGIIFAISSLNAANEAHKSFNLPNASLNDAIRAPFYEGRVSPKDYKAVEKYFEYSKFDYTAGFIVALFMIVIITACLVIFVRRLFDLVILYVMSPYFVSTYPLDDGKRFQKWRDLFLGKAFSGFGMVVAMRLYLMMVPVIMTGSISFQGELRPGDNVSPEFDYVVKTVFLIGGAWAILKSGPMITSLLSEAAGGQEAQDAMTGTALAMLTGGTAVSAVKAGGGLLAGKLFKKKEDEGPHQFVKPKDEKDKEKENDSLFKKDGKPKAFSEGKVIGKSLGGLFKKFEYDELDKNGKKKTGWGVSLGALGSIGHSKDGVGFELLGCGYKRANGKTGSVKILGANWKRNAEGNMKFEGVRIAPLGLDVSRDHKTGDFQFKKLGILGLKREADQDGNYSWTGGSILFQNKFAVDEKTGDRYLQSSSSLMGLWKSEKFAYDSESHKSYQTRNTTLFGLWKDQRFEYDAGTQKAYQTSTSVLGGLVKKQYAQDPADGQLHTLNTSVFGVETYRNKKLEEDRRDYFRKEGK